MTVGFRMKNNIPDRFKAAFDWVKTAPIEEVYAAVDRFPRETEFDHEFHRRQALSQYSFSVPSDPSKFGPDLFFQLTHPILSNFRGIAYSKWLNGVCVEDSVAREDPEPETVVRSLFKWAA